MHKLLYLPLLVLTVGLAAAEAPQLTDLRPGEVALIQETVHLCRRLGPSVWKDWSDPRGPFLLRTQHGEYLLDHPKPPADFRPFESAILGRTIWVKAAADSAEVQAAYPVGGVQTVVISAPGPDYNPCLWVLKAAHEIFHCHQGLSRPVNPFTGQYKDNNELNFPFPYADPAVRSAYRLEAELVFALCTEPAPLRFDPRLLGHLAAVQRKILADEDQFRFKQWMEWNEGVARYTERQLADRARDSKLYTPLENFREAFPQCSYQNVWQESYKDQLNPIRFIGEGVQGSVMFYYMGMGKAYALDRLVPGWKDRYMSRSLDDLLQEAVKEPTACEKK